MMPVTRKQSESFVNQNSTTLAKKHLNTMMINNMLKL